MFEKYFTPTKQNKLVKVTFTSVPCGKDTNNKEQQYTHQNVVCVYYNMFKLLETHGSCIETTGECFAPLLPCYQFTANLSHHLCLVWGLGSLGEVTPQHLKVLQEYVKGVGDDTPQAWLDLIAIYCTAKRFANKFSYNEIYKQGCSLIQTCQNKCKSLGHGFQAYVLETMVTMASSGMYTASLDELYRENNNLLLIYQHGGGQGAPYTLPVQFGNNEPSYELPINVSELRNLINYDHLAELALKYFKTRDEVLKRAKSLITSRTSYNTICKKHMKQTLTTELKLNFSYKHWDHITLKAYTQQYVDNIMCLAKTEYKTLVPLYTNFTVTWLAKQLGTLTPERFNTIHSLVQEESGGFFSERELLVLLSYYNTESKEHFEKVVCNLMDHLSRYTNVKTYMAVNLPYTPPSFQYLVRYLITVKFLLENSLVELIDHGVQAPLSELSDLLLGLGYTCVDLARPDDPTAPYYLATAVLATHQHIIQGPKKVSLPTIALLIKSDDDEAHNSIWQIEKESFQRLSNTVDWKELKKDQETVDQSMVWVAPALLSADNLYDYITDLYHTNDTPQEVKQLLFIHNEPTNWKEKVERVLEYYENNPVNTTHRVELFVSTMVTVLGYYLILVDNPQLTKRLFNVCLKIVKHLVETCINACKHNSEPLFFKGLRAQITSAPLHVLAAARASEHMCYQGGKPC